MVCAHISHIQHLTFLEVLGAAPGQGFPLWPRTVRQPHASNSPKCVSMKAGRKRAPGTQSAAA